MEGFVLTSKSQTPRTSECDPAGTQALCRGHQMRLLGGPHPIGLVSLPYKAGTLVDGRCTGRMPRSMKTADYTHGGRPQGRPSVRAPRRSQACPHLEGGLWPPELGASTSVAEAPSLWPFVMAALEANTVANSKTQSKAPVLKPGFLLLKPGRGLVIRQSLWAPPLCPVSFSVRAPRGHTSSLGELTYQLGASDNKPKHNQDKQHVRRWQRLWRKIKLGRERGLR